MVMAHGGRRRSPAYLSLALLVHLSLVSAFFTPHPRPAAAAAAPWFQKYTTRHPTQHATPNHHDAAADSSATQEEEHVTSKQQKQNSSYIQGLLTNLEACLDKWIVSGSPDSKQRAQNILQQIQKQAMDVELKNQANRMVQRAGLSITTTTESKTNTTADKKELGKTDGDARRQVAAARTQWESEWEAQRQDAAISGRSALSNRSAGGSSKPDILLGSINSNLETFANSKRDLQKTMEGTTTSSNDNKDTINQSRTDQEAAMMKSAELVAMAGAGFAGDKMGIGGLDEVLAEIKRRIWVPLAAPPLLLQELGISPVRGLLLYGRPGCGKTLLARTVGRILSPARPITVVSGPELMDKFVGSSEKNLRDVFDNPPDIYNPQDEAMARAALHVIILDEFDAMARSRGGRKGGDQGDAGVARDSVVNQLLAKMDGVDPLVVPTLVIGLTNKRSLIDAALLRPGRFEVQIEVPPPRTAEQRVSILKVHTLKMYEAGRLLVRDAPAGTAAAKHANEALLTYDELLGLLAAECKGMSGASLAGVARAAASHALERAVIDFSSTGHSMLDCLVTQQDFEDAVVDVFEKSNDDWEEDENETDIVGKEDVDPNNDVNVENSDTTDTTTNDVAEDNQF